MIVEDNGRVKLMDFGIAKTRAEGDQEDEDIVGTAEYMSPEQALGRKMDGRADIYSLGIMAFEMLTGRLPFDSHDPYEILRKHVREPVPAPSTVNAKVPPDLDEFVRRSTAKQPAQRFQTCREIEEFLSRAEPKPLNLKTARAKTLTLIYDGIEEDKVNALVQRVLTEAKTIPSIHVGVMETKQFH